MSLCLCLNLPASLGQKQKFNIIPLHQKLIMTNGTGIMLFQIKQLSTLCVPRLPSVIVSPVGRWVVV